MILGLLIAIFGFYLMSNGGSFIGLGIAGFGWFLSGLFDSEHPANIAIGLIIIAIAFIWGAVYSENEKNGTNAKRRLEELEKIENERQQAILSQRAGEPWRTRYATYPCPHCGHYKVRCAKWEDKRLSISFWGAASSAIGKEFKCEHCGKMW